MVSKKGVIGALIAAAILGTAAVGGVVLAQTPSSGGQGGPSATAQAPGNGRGAALRSRIDSFLNQLAQNLNIDRPTLDNALKTTAKQQVAQAVADGRLTQAQADQIDQRIDNGQAPFGMGFGAGRFGRAGSGRGGAGAGAFAACASTARDAVASALGMSASDLQQARQSGQTIAQIAQSQGKSLQDIGSAVSASVKGCLDQQVQAGTLTSDQEQKVLQRIQQRAIASPSGDHHSGAEKAHPGQSTGASQ